jgi:hypothetical protein
MTTSSGWVHLHALPGGAPAVFIYDVDSAYQERSTNLCNISTAKQRA